MMVVTSQHCEVYISVFNLLSEFFIIRIAQKTYVSTFYVYNQFRLNYKCSSRGKYSLYTGADNLLVEIHLFFIYKFEFNLIESLELCQRKIHSISLKSRCKTSLNSIPPHILLSNNQQINHYSIYWILSALNKFFPLINKRYRQHTIFSLYSGRKAPSTIFIRIRRNF